MSSTASVTGSLTHNDEHSFASACQDNGEAGYRRPRSESDYDDDVSTDEQRGALSKKETLYVRMSRLTVLLVLLGAAAGVSTFVFLFTHNDEVAEFEETFAEYAEQITRTVHRNAQHKLEATAAIALEVQAHAINTGSTWPNVTVPFFEEHIMATQSLTDAYGVQLFPIVTNETRAGWEAYSVNNRDWINASFFAQRQAYGVDQSKLERGQTGDPEFNWFDHLWGEDYVNEQNPDFSTGIASQIFGTLFNEKKQPAIDPNDGPFFPQWQVAPMGWYYQGTVNLNYGTFDDFLNQTQIVTKTGNAAYGMAWNDGVTPGYISTMLYPIFDLFYGDKSKVVGFIGIDLYWQAFIERILPPSADGIYVVIENAPPCNQTFTFQIFGDRAEFKDDGDVHEAASRFESMKQSFSFGSELMEPISDPTYKGRPLYDDFCPYTFHIYPSQELEDRYVTKKPIWYTVIIFSVFVFTSLVFYTYDVLVEHRQKLVLKSANQADAVVSSLFPQGVKEQLYEKEQDKDPVKRRGSQSSAPINRRGSFTMMRRSSLTNAPTNLRGSLNMADFGGHPSEVIDELSVSPDPPMYVSPIAELYKETTICFADLVGFTSWSSDRQPSEVFQLLETIYGSFDVAAKRRHVFKVETIGDCYVAVTGLPKPQQHHAVIMCKFADEIRYLMRNELAHLAETLGPKTLELQLRIGLHSGPVTAGVLRGDKARFQLFGDSMNTAARMESHSKPGCIHVSEATANELIARGKGSWAVRRDDRVTAKGKGEMTTFWVNVPKEGSVVSSLSMMDNSWGESSLSTSSQSWTKPADLTDGFVNEVEV